MMFTRLRTKLTVLYAALFGAYALNRHLSVTVGYADLGEIANFKDQRGLYLSLQAGF